MSIARPLLYAEREVARHNPGHPDHATDATGQLREDATHFYLLRRLMMESKILTRRFGLSPQLLDAMLEMTVCTEPDGITIGGLAVRLGIKHNSVVGIVNRLCTKGLAVRVDCTQDGRRVYVHATREGQAQLQGLVKVLREAWSHGAGE